jgi:hypothetical protein
VNKRINSPLAAPAVPPNTLARRCFLGKAGLSLGAIALNQLLGEQSRAAAPPSSMLNPPSSPSALSPKPPHHLPKAKRIIYLFMGGAPSHLELFDYKPQLTKLDGQLPPPSMLAGYRSAFINANAPLLAPKFRFARHGQCGAELSELLPNLAGLADDFTLIKSMHTDAFNHAPGQILMSTGVQQFGRPSIGAWVTYGLGSESANLPAFVVLSTGIKGTSGGASNWGSGFLPSTCQGVPFRNIGDPVMHLSSPPGFDDQLQRDSLDGIKELNTLRLNKTGDPEIATRINSFEMAYRMQTSAPELMDIASEPQAILDMYGAVPGKPSFANSCLLARRLIERGVRFVQIFHEAWDHHSNLTKGLQTECAKTDQPSAALIKDLKARGLLDDTLVIWGGEFGRSPMAQGGTDGRDHHPNAFTMLLAGGGTKPGLTYGQTDELGFNVTQNPVHIHDLHATTLHLLGLDHTRLTYRFQGRDFRLTDIAGKVMTDIVV